MNLRRSSVDYSKLPPPNKTYPMEDFPEHTVSRAYVEFATRNMLLQQTSKKLDKRALLKPNGGLCASSCFTNVIGAITAQSNNFLMFPKLAPQVIHIIIEAYNKYTRDDARMGTYMNSLARVIQNMGEKIFSHFEYIGFPFERMSIKFKEINTGFHPDQIHRVMEGDSIAIASVKRIVETDPDSKTTQRTDEYNFIHAIVLLKVNVEGKYLVISDPNLPNKIMVVPFKRTRDGNIRFRIPTSYKHVVELYTLNILTRVFETDLNSF